MVNGNKLWGEKCVSNMIKKAISDKREIYTYLNIPDSLYHSLQRTAKAYPDKTAIVDNYGRSYTFGGIMQRTEELAAYLHCDRGIGQRSHVGLMMYNCVEFCIALLAVSRLGAVAVPLPSKFRKPEVLSLSRKADISLVICDADFAGWFRGEYTDRQILAVRQIEKQYGYNECLSSWRDREKDLLSLRQVPAGDSMTPALIMFTSGTTSKSKGVLLKNYNIMHAAETYRRTLEITAEDNSVIATPIYHITGIVALFGLFVLTGGTLYLHKFFDAGRVVEDARKYGFTFIHASPTVFALLIEAGRGTPEIPGLSSFACGSSNMLKEKILQLHRWLPNSKFHTVYGLTETSSPAAIFPEDAASSEYIGSSGFPVPGTKFKIVDEEGRELPAGSVGEIMISGSVVLESYYKQEDASLKEGWLHTGDLGCFNEEGYLFVVDRLKNMINRGGEKIWCFDLENEIAAIPGILDAAVVGIPDELYGEAAAAVVVQEPGSHLTEKDILEYLKSRIAKYKVPARIRIMERIPQTANGKTDKIRIKEILMEEL